MSIYLVPENGEFEEIVSIAKRAGVKFIAPGSIREFILETAHETMVIVAMKSKDLLVLNKNSGTLLDEMPSVVMSIPGLVYNGEWVALATAFPPLDWSELERKLAKSGHLATNSSDLEKRDTGESNESYAEYSNTMGGVRSGSSSWGKPKTPDVDEDSDPDMEID